MTRPNANECGKSCRTAETRTQESLHTPATYVPMTKLAKQFLPENQKLNKLPSREEQIQQIWYAKATSSISLGKAWVAKLNPAYLYADANHYISAANIEMTVNKLKAQNAEADMLGLITACFDGTKLVILDGVHRAIAAIVCGIDSILVAIYDQEAKANAVKAALYNPANRVTSIQLFNARLNTNDEIVLGIKELCRKYCIDICESTTITNRTAALLMRIADANGLECLDWILKLLEDSYWLHRYAGTDMSLKHSILTPIAAAWRQNQTNLEACRENLLKFLTALSNGRLDRNNELANSLRCTLDYASRGHVQTIILDVAKNGAYLKELGL